MKTMDNFDISRGFHRPTAERLSPDLVGINNDYSQIKENDLFLSLKTHIDFQCKLNQLNQSRIRSFERFRKYCQTLTSSSSSSSSYLELTKFDQEQFRNEYNRFDRNYRYWRKRIRKLRKETKLSLNPYDILYELFAKIESIDRCKLNDQYQPEDRIYPEISINITKDEPEINEDFTETSTENNECNFHCFVDGCGRMFSLKTDYLDHLFEHSIDVNQKNAATSKTKQSKKVLAKKRQSPNRAANVTRITSSRRTSRGNTAQASNVKRKSSTLKKLPKTPVIAEIVPPIKKHRTSELSKSKLKNLNKSKTQKKSRNRRKQTDIPTVWSCDVEGCNFVGRFLSNLKVHQVSHSDLRPFKCDQCEMAFKYKGLLNSHKIVTHEGKRHECPFEGCQTKLSNAFRLRQHVEIVHTKDAPKFQCPVEGCDYTTYRAQALRRHSAVHSDERPHKCMWPGCTKSFKLSTNLSDHLLMHKNERQFKCKWPDCSYACNTGNNLIKHHSLHEKKDASKRIAQEESELNLINHDQQQDQEQEPQQQYYEMAVTIGDLH